MNSTPPSANRLKTPVAVFAYNRPEHVDRALAALARCSRRDRCEFHFYSDGAKTPDAEPQVAATRARLHARARDFGARVVERPVNLGLARSIVSGVGDLCASHGRVIVVEDDLVVSPDFLHFMTEALDRYEQEPAVFQVAGCTLSPPAVPDSDAFLLPVTTTWGWATWQRAWQAFDWKPADIDSMAADPEWLDRFNLGGTCNFTGMLADRLAGRNDSWGILWWYAVARRRGLVAYPARNLVWNGGFDGSGIHCGTRGWSGDHEADSLSDQALPDAPRFPERVDFAPEHLAQLQAHFRAAVAPAGRDVSRTDLPARIARVWKGLRHGFR